MSRGRAQSKARRDARYRRAVVRQIGMVARWKAAPAELKRTLWMPAPVEDFLRPGDTIAMFAEVPFPGGDHSACDFAWKPVECDRCGAEYVCTPSSDFYCADEGDHCCEPCLLRGVGVPVLLIGGDQS